MLSRLPPLNALRAFHAAARCGSFTAAADTLGVTHGAVSRQVARLEAHLGVTLFRRTTRRIVLTADGEALLAATDRAFGLIEAAAAAIEAPRRRPLAVSCIATFSMWWLIPRLPRFHARYPDIEVRLSAPGPSEAEVPPDAEIAIRVTPCACPADRQRLDFLPEEIGPVLSPAALVRRPVRNGADLAGHVRLETASRPAAWAEWAQAGGTLPASAEPRRFETFYFMLQAAAAGLGVAIGPRPLVEADIVSGRLAAPLGFRPSGRAYCALYRRRDADDSRLRRFRDWLVEESATPP